MEQSKLGSFIEATINTLIGFFLSFLAWPVAAAIFEIPYTHSQHFGVVLFFTVLSIVRGYAVRRWFNYRLKRLARRLAEQISGEPSQAGGSER